MDENDELNNELPSEEPEPKADNQEDSSTKESSSREESEKLGDGASNVEMEQSPIKEFYEGRSPSEALQNRFLSLLNRDMRELDKVSESYPKMDSSSGSIGQSWTSAYIQGMENLLKGSALSDAVERADSAWRQKVDADGEKLAAGRPRFGSSEGSVISGERALMKATNLLGLGAVVQVPLWHTGIWVSMKAPSESSLLELERRIANEKITLGRSTSGMVFSNTGIYITSYVVNFILNHIYDASVKNISQDHLKSIIKSPDIPLLVWGMACAIYPDGYDYARPCTTNPAECQHVVEGKINLAKLVWTDTDALTLQQRRMMARRNDKFTDEEIRRYQDDHIRGGNKTIDLHEELRVKLKVPTIAEYERSGFSWVDGIVSLLEGSLGVSLKGQERDDYIISQGRLTAIRQYAHWVEEISVGEDTIEDEETIDALLGNLSSKEEISDQFFEKVGQYIDESVISLVAIPKYRCPACGGEQKGDVHNVKHPHLLPLDVLKVFFTLHNQRMYRALTKAHL